MSKESMSKESAERYVRALDVEQVGSKATWRKTADAWLGNANQIDDGGVTFVTLEIQPAWGSHASIRLSLDELRQLGRMIANRIGDKLEIPGAGTVELSVPEGTAVRIDYT